MKEKESNYYDQIYRESQSYALPYTASPYYKLWKKVLALIIEKNPRSIFEIGCGTGQFARMMMDTIKGVHYSGIDFSSIAIDKAQINVPEFKETIRKMDIYNYKIPPDNLILVLEVLEHVDDIKVLQSIPYGSAIIFTVPDFDDPAHVRYFNDITEIKQRYKDCINFTFMEKHERWFICFGIIK